MPGTTPSITSERQEYFFSALDFTDAKSAGSAFMGKRVEPVAMRQWGSERVNFRGTRNMLAHHPHHLLTYSLTLHVSGTSVVHKLRRIELLLLLLHDWFL
jgi:hypothetical protein